MTREKRRKSRALPGRFYAIPLSGGRSAIVMVAACDKAGRSFGYFFKGGILSPSSHDLLSFAPDGADFTRRFSALGIENGQWPMIGSAVDFDRTRWPMLPGVHRDVITKKPSIRYYEPESMELVREERTSEEDPRLSDLPDDGFFGHVLIVRMLEKL